MRKFIFLLIIFFSSCTTKKHIVNEKAKELYRSAINSMKPFDTLSYKKAISLLDSAIEIDTNFYKAYFEKCAIQLQLEQYDNALETSKQLNRINPNNPDNFSITGSIYLKIGDTISSKKCFQKAIIGYDKDANRIFISKKERNSILLNKAMLLIMYGDEKEGRNILNQLYKDESDINQKEALKQLLNTSKDELIEETSIEN